MCLEQSILTVHGSCDIQYHSTTNIIEFNITDCSEKSDSHPGTHCVSLSPCITHQVHPAPSAKTIPRMGLPLIEAGLIQTVFPNTFLIHTMRTLSLSVVCRGFDGTGLARLAEPQFLANHMAFSKYTSQYLKVPLPIAFNVVFNSPLYHSIFPETGALTGNMIHPLKPMVSGSTRLFLK